MTHRWNAVWDARPAPPAMPSVIERLMIGGGLDSGFAGLAAPAWLDFVRQIAQRLTLRPHESVFEVGCGAGAFLYRLHQDGMRVSGIDRAAALVAVAAEVMPGGKFRVADAADVDPREPFDAVLSFGVFLYFPSTDYAEHVLDLMVAKADRVVAVFDIPDAARCEAALSERIRLSGGADPYEQRYRGLDHRYYARDWFATALRRRGLVDVHVEDQAIAGYGNTPFRFNAWGFVRASSSNGSR